MAPLCFAGKGNSPALVQYSLSANGASAGALAPAPSDPERCESKRSRGPPRPTCRHVWCSCAILWRLFDLARGPAERAGPDTLSPLVGEGWGEGELRRRASCSSPAGRSHGERGDVGKKARWEHDASESRECQGTSRDSGKADGQMFVTTPAVPWVVSRRGYSAKIKMSPSLPAGSVEIQETHGVSRSVHPRTSRRRESVDPR